MIIYVDIDGTICSQETSNNYDKAEPYYHRIDRINKLYEDGHTIHYWTARGTRSGIDWTDVTKQQLEKWDCKHHNVTVGAKPHFDLYICDKSVNADDWFCSPKYIEPVTNYETDRHTY
jgi:hypothetical protein